MARAPLHGARPDRAALWAVLMALFIIAVAASSAHAAVAAGHSAASQTPQALVRHR